MTVEDYNRCISEARDKIDSCNELKTEISNFTSDLNNCAKELSSSANSLSEGLVINGVAKGSGIAETASTISTLSSDLSEAVSLIDDLITQLENEISGLENERDSLATMINTFFSGIFG